MTIIRKWFLIVLSVFLTLSLGACQKEAEPVDPYPERDVDYPTEIPDLGEDSVYIHYQREDNTYDNWTLWLWDPDGNDDGLEDDFNYQDDYGVIAAYPLSHFGSTSFSRLGMIVKNKGSWAVKDGTDADRFVNLSTWKKDDKGIYHIYLAGGDEHIYETSEKIIQDVLESASFLTDTAIHISASRPLDSFRVYENGTMIYEGDGSGRSNFTERNLPPADIEKNYEVEVTFRESGTVLRTDVSLTGLYGSDSFNEKFYYDGELGALYSKKKTEFRVWSPVSEEIVLRIYETGTPASLGGSDSHEDHEMTKVDKGVFVCALEGDYDGKYYTYFVKNSTYPQGAEVVDPYARAAGVNGLRGMVCDFSKTDPEGWNKVKYLPYDRKELTVYETHVADVTSNATWTG
ncbi:MAG: hypothetical protein IIZ47_05330, partial [Erysipelotrichaceae bacterium]|nr:hypothetical protein [Erysipelotrichaceae bacterium]